MMALGRVHARLLGESVEVVTPATSARVGDSNSLRDSDRRTLTKLFGDYQVRLKQCNREEALKDGCRRLSKMNVEGEDLAVLHREMIRLGLKDGKIDVAVTKPERRVADNAGLANRDARRILALATELQGKAVKKGIKNRDQGKKEPTRAATVLHEPASADDLKNHGRRNTRNTVFARVGPKIGQELRRKLATADA